MSVRERNRAAQRARILDSASELFANRGFEDVTVAEIAEAAGVARATVFNHFRSKHGLVEEITQQVLQFYLGMLERALANETATTSALVRALFEQMGAGIEIARSFYRGVFREIAKLGLGLDEGGPGQRSTELALDQLEKLFARGQERGEIRIEASPQALASAFTALVNGTITHWLYADSGTQLRVRMAGAADVLLGPVAAPGEGLRPGESLPDLASSESSPSGRSD